MSTPVDDAGNNVPAQRAISAILNDFGGNPLAAQANKITAAAQTRIAAVGPSKTSYRIVDRF